jgi:hypothetical protein
MVVYVRLSFVIPGNPAVSQTTHESNDIILPKFIDNY